MDVSPEQIWSVATALYATLSSASPNAIAISLGPRILRAETAALAASVPDTGGVVLVPALSGLGAPHWRPEARAALTGMSFATTRAHLARAALEATANQTRDYLLDLYRTAWRHSDESLATVALDAPASVPWWPEERRATTFGHLVVRVVAETAQHAGHADLVRELIDGRAGDDTDDRASFVARIQAAADTFDER